MKMKIVNIILCVVVIAAIIGVAGAYLFDVFYRKTPFDKNLFRTLAIVFFLLGTLVRLLGGKGRKELEVYERAYAKELGYAFKNKPMQRKKLLCACRLYDEGNYSKSLKYLFQLLREAEFERDCVPVYLFIAICYTDANCPDDAIKAYYELLKLDPNHAQAHSNLGGQLIKVGAFKAAVEHYNKSIEINPDNYFAYINRANYYFRINEYDNAIPDAEKALEIKNNGAEAASLLAIIYALKNDDENKKKYYHIAIASGKRPEDINQAIEYFMNENNIPDGEEGGNEAGENE